MRILLCHNFYRSSAPSGEDAVYQNEKALLESNNIDVIPFELHNDDIDDSSLPKQIGLAARTLWSRGTYRNLRKVLKSVKPDLVHLHNTFPQISPSAYAASRDSQIPVVQTLHNYRLICPGALLIRNEKPCEDCIGRYPAPALRHRCYRNSLAATATLAGMITLNRVIGTYRSSISTYIALTQFSASRFINAGFPPAKIVVKPNFLPKPPPPGKGLGRYAVYVGRLSPEKGVNTLLSAWRKIQDTPLKILGDGPLRAELEETARRENLNVEFLGSVSKDEVLDTIKDASIQIIPSEWYEGFPMVALEGFACGTPLLVSRIGSLQEIITEGETGMSFVPGDPADLAEKATALINDDASLSNMRRNARKHFETSFTADKNFQLLKKIYDRVINEFNGQTFR